MTANQRRRQKKLERRTAKRKGRRHELSRKKNLSLHETLALASRAPILHCRISENLTSEGIGWAVISRQLSAGMVAMACFLIDSFCLGVKDAFGRTLGRSEYDEMCETMAKCVEMEDHAPADVRKVVEGAVEYARNLGFEPHAEYRRVCSIFGDIDPRESDEEFEYGSEGMPLFIRGPDDSPERCRQILSTLDGVCGPGGYQYDIEATPLHVLSRLIGRSERTRLFGEVDDDQDDDDERADEDDDEERGEG